MHYESNIYLHSNWYRNDMIHVDKLNNSVWDKNIHKIFSFLVSYFIKCEPNGHGSVSIRNRDVNTSFESVYKVKYVWLHLLAFLDGNGSWWIAMPRKINFAVQYCQNIQTIYVFSTAGLCVMEWENKLRQKRHVFYIYITVGVFQEPLALFQNGISGPVSIWHTLKWVFNEHFHPHF